MVSERKYTFDQIPDLYDEARPGYPETLLKAVSKFAALKSESQIVEIGAGTGKATQYFAKLGCRLTAVEIGPGLCRFLGKKFSDCPDVTIENSAFEDWQGKSGFYDLFLSAQAFHFVAPESGLMKAAQLLKPFGSIALVWTVDYSQNGEFFKRATPIHQKYFPESSENPETQTIVSVYEAALRDCDLFMDLQKKEYSWSKDYSVEAFIRLRSTFSPDLMLSEGKRAEFYSELRRLIGDLGGTVTRLYKTVALLGRRIDLPLRALR